MYSDNFVLKRDRTVESIKERKVSSSDKASEALIYSNNKIVSLKPNLDDEVEMNSESQDSTFVPDGIVPEEISKLEMPAYSIVLYKPTAPREGTDKEPEQLVPMEHHVPVKVQSLCLAALPAQSNFMTLSGQNTDFALSSGNILQHSQPMDPLWLQFLTNIMSRQHNSQQSDNSAQVPGVYPSLVYVVPKVGLAQTTVMAVGTNNMNYDSVGDEAASKPGLNASKQNNTNQNFSVKNSKDIPCYHIQPQSTLSSQTHGTHSKLAAVNKGYIRHNSSGEETQQPSPLSSDASFTLMEPVLGSGMESKKLGDCNLPLMTSSPHLDHDRGAGPLRESHNMKERRRRARIKDACNLMRQLVPGMSKKTDKATVFEFSARYIHFLKSFVGTNNDKDFLVKYNPY